MTRLPHENRSVRGVETPGDKNTLQILEPICSHPYCKVSGRENLELHELWPRSFLRRQPIEYVELWDGTIVGNQVFLCNSFQNGHHQMITENKSEIVWMNGRFIWSDDAFADTIKPQPCVYGPEKSQDAKQPSDGVAPGGDAGYVLEGLTEAYKNTPCPKCQGTGVKPLEDLTKKKEKARNRVSKSIRVPKDEQENGVEILEDMIEQVEEVLRPGEKPRAPYYTLVDALGLCIVNKDVIL